MKQDVGFRENVFYYLQEVLPEWITLYHSVQNRCQGRACEKTRAPVVTNEWRGMRTSCFLQRGCVALSLAVQKAYRGTHNRSHWTAQNFSPSFCPPVFSTCWAAVLRRSCQHPVSPVAIPNSTPGNTQLCWDPRDISFCFQGNFGGKDVINTQVTDKVGLHNFFPETKTRLTMLSLSFCVVCATVRSTLDTTGGPKCRWIRYKELITVPRLTELCPHRGANTIPLI